MSFLQFYWSKVLPLSIILLVSSGLSFLAQSVNYTQNAISINESVQIVQGASNIQKMNEQNGFTRRTLKSIYDIVANRDGSYVYEIGEFDDDEGASFNYVMVRKGKEEGSPIELEFYARNSDFTSASEAIGQRRKEWIDLCNKHDAAGLINELYAENTMYYNHKPLITGREGVIKDYQYMNRESYSLKLTPLKTKQVNDRIALEIGQCSGSYNGKYIIVWQKDAMGKWEVLLDSNI